MSYRTCTILQLAMVMALLGPDTFAQKPPAPAPQPPGQPSAPPNRPSPLGQPGSDPNSTQPDGDIVMFLRGRIAMPDGSAVPTDLLIQRICNNRVRQEVYASPSGDFSMQLGSNANSFAGLTAEASSEGTSPFGSKRKDTSMGIPRHELINCDLRASGSGFRSNVVNLMGLDTFGSSMDVGVIVVQRGTKVEGATVSAIPYKAPKGARKAYEKGVQAEKNGKLADAHKYFQTAVEIYPNSANAWFQFGAVLQKENDKDAARKAYTQATTIDSKFLPPYLSLASLAYETGNWSDVLAFTNHILDLDPFNNAATSNYILDLDPRNYTGAYFYNAVANYRLNRMGDAEKSALKAEHLDLRTDFPQLHLLLAEIFARKNEYTMAISHLETYLEMLPQGKGADRAREQLAQLQKLNDSAATSEKPN